MPKSETQLKQLSKLPISWLSEGRLKSSLILRHSPAEIARIPKILETLTQERFSTANTEIVFPSIREPSKETLARSSDDYLRCILAKSAEAVYQKATPKYRNEAARKQFFTRLLEIIELCYLSETSSGLREIQAPGESDRVLTWVQKEMTSLVVQKTNLAVEHASKLETARVEFRTFLRNLEEMVGLQWENAERYQRLLFVTSFFPPGVFENESTWRWGAQWYPEIGALNIAPPVLFIDTIRKGVLAREAAVLLSPKNLDNMEYAPRVLCEQAEYFGYKMLDRRNDRDFWALARHGLRRASRVAAGDLIDFFEYYEMMVGPTLYREVWLRLKEFGTARLTVADYYIIFNTLAARPTRQTFSNNEMKLLTLLSKKPDVKAGEAARTLRISIPTTMKAIRELSSKAGLRFTVIVAMHSIGLVESLLLISTSKQARVINALSRFPYCRQLFRTYGSYDLFGVLDIPFEHQNFVKELVQLMLDKGLVTRCRILELERDFQAVNFDRYDAEAGRWSVHWDSWGIGLRESLSNGGSFRMDSNARAERFRFDKLDLRILSELQDNCRMPYSAMGRALGVSGAYVGKKIDRMIREGVFRFAVWPLKIGAEDWGIVSLKCSRNVAAILAQYLSQLPAWRGGLVRGDFDGLLAMVWCPSGEMKQLFKAVDDRLIRNGYAEAQCLNAVGEWVVARWLPVEPFPWDLSGEDSNWIFDEKRYLSLIG
jgi:DNA-binding Lrp family transcriptional regulator